GTARTIAMHLLRTPPGGHRIDRFVVVDVSAERLGAFRALVEPVRGTTEVRFHRHEDARENTPLLASLAPYSLVVNATGLGKDRPGSPLANDALWPEHAIAWELNYR